MRARGGPLPVATHTDDYTVGAASADDGRIEAFIAGCSCWERSTCWKRKTGRTCTRCNANAAVRPSGAQTGQPKWTTAGRAPAATDTASPCSACRGRLAAFLTLGFDMVQARVAMLGELLFQSRSTHGIGPRPLFFWQELLPRTHSSPTGASSVVLDVFGSSSCCRLTLLLLAQKRHELGLCSGWCLPPSQKCAFSLSMRLSMSLAMDASI